MLAKQEPNFFGSLPIEAWVSEATAGTDIGTTAFWWLCYSFTGRVILESLSRDCQSQFFNKLPESAWSSAPEEGVHRGKTSLYWLCDTDKGLDILANQAPEFVTSLPIEAWSSVVAEGRDAGKSAFWCLCAYPVGRFILGMFPPEFFNNLPTYTWSSAPKKGADRGKTPLYWLCGTDIGLNILAKQSPEFFASLPMEAWLSAATEDTDAGGSAFRWSCIFPIGRQILNGLSDDFFKSLPFSVLLSRVKGGVYRNKATFLLLLETDGGQCILSRWMPNLAAQLCDHVKNRHDIGITREISTVLVWLHNLYGSIFTILMNQLSSHLGPRLFRINCDAIVENLIPHYMSGIFSKSEFWSCMHNNQFDFNKRIAGVEHAIRPPCAGGEDFASRYVCALIGLRTAHDSVNAVDRSFPKPIM